MSKHYLVYQITNLVNNKIYIGIHITENVEDGYMGSGKNIRRAVSKYGPNCFEKTILFDFNNPEEMVAKEAELVDRKFIARKDTYNITCGGRVPICHDTIVVKDVNGRCFKVHKTDERWLSGELKHNTFGLKTSKKPAKEPNGFKHSDEFKKKIGSINAAYQKGSGNSQYGTCWVHNISLKENRKIKKEDLDSFTNSGWTKGRKMKFD